MTDNNEQQAQNVIVPIDADLPRYRKDGESFDRPAWHAWVYGGAKNPLLHGRERVQRGEITRVRNA